MLPARVFDIAAGQRQEVREEARKVQNNAREFFDGESKMEQNAHRGIFVRQVSPLAWPKPGPSLA